MPASPGRPSSPAAGEEERGAGRERDREVVVGGDREGLDEGPEERERARHQDEGRERRAPPRGEDQQRDEDRDAPRGEERDAAEAVSSA